jgi:hypothetical protein
MYDRESEFEGEDETPSLLSDIKTYDKEMMMATAATDEIRIALFIENV